jgi:hypothetical protein
MQHSQKNEEESLHILTDKFFFFHTKFEGIIFQTHNQTNGFALIFKDGQVHIRYLSVVRDKY